LTHLVATSVISVGIAMAL